MFKFVYVLVGLVFLQVDLDQRGVQDINGCLFLLVMGLSSINMFTAAHVNAI